MRRIVCAAITAIIAPVVLIASDQSKSAEDEVRAVLKALSAARAAADRTTWGAHATEDYVFTVAAWSTTVLRRLRKLTPRNHVPPCQHAKMNVFTFTAAMS